ncbi:DMT family transporter [Aliarcobacter thereius]|uniref:Aromatic amino acid exporter n=2 Tax=Aliarcobacter thereius TaxID=544718 RepID=A0A1C0B5X0_9BACT|nr:DMT family transporter [Aliarcobacter thereius]OCL90388.1 aromatic amino acid exporter [Aliarcobacter thereius]OCL95857.1 aromatic amino acid exporter [Aliarcobacter thereius LMG 24486]OCL98426.1 aromatic amino acid exporter [Aliarcobacter thereius]QBF16170.1 putative membrane protein, putative permease (EamA domain) [Aliarcobacter thereius LMG 24486]TLS92202.1 DMT family transporter [Aliarcobacter thereius]
MIISQTKLGVIYIALCIFLWSLLGIFVKLAQSNLDHYQYMFYSSLFSFLSLLFVALVNKNLKEILSYTKKIFFVLFALGFLDFMFYLLLYFGYHSANSIEVLVIQYTWPIFIVVLSLFILKEKFTKRKLFAVTFGFIGVFLVISKGDISNLNFENIDVLLVVLLSAFCFALFSVLSKKVRIDAVNAVMIYFLSATIYSFFTMQTFSSFVIPESKDWIAILVNGVFINGISYLFWIKGLQIFDASKVAPFTFLIPILSAFFLVIVFDEAILMIYFVGLLFVVLAGLINSFKTLKEV